MSRRSYGMRGSRSQVRTMVLLVLVLLMLLTFDTVDGVPYKRSLLRLCSRNLSDALDLVCKGRGYNEPFSYSSEDDAQDATGPGLAEECCYHNCSYEYLEQYCKPENASSADAVTGKVWIQNYPYPSTRPATSKEERSRSDIEDGIIKCKIHGSKGARKKGAKLDRNDDAAGCDRRNLLKKHRVGRHGRQGRRRHNKLLVQALPNRSV